LEDALIQARKLIQAELSLARRELHSELTSASSVLLFLAIGAMLLQAALVTLAVLVVMTLGPGYAALAVVGGLLLAGAACALLAKRALQHKKLPRTLARLSTDTREILESAK
jgi:uncharacterized membrane protein YqjE